MIVVVDYRKGNLKSVERGLAAAGGDVRVSDDPALIAQADAIVLPGVGAFADAAATMQALGQTDAIRRRIAAGVPFLGICLGMHLLFEEGVEGAPEEDDGQSTHNARGLAVLPGVVTKMPRVDAAGRACKVPHVGWNTVVPPACQPAEQAGAAEVSGTESCGSKPSSRPEGRYVGLSPQSPAPETPSLTSRTTGDFSCGNCSNCKGDFEAVDVTDTARAVMRCVQELRGRFGKGMVVDVLRGSQNAKVLDLHLDQAASFHTVDAPASQVKEVVELLAAGGYLAITEGSYPVVGLGPRAREAAEEGFSLSMKRVVRKAERARKAGGGVGMAAGTAFGGSGTASFAEDVPALFERLRALRKRLADEAGVPPYIVFSDATLRDMCAKLPATEDEFLDVSGVGATKLARYGAAFLEELAAWQGEAAE